MAVWLNFIVLELDDDPNRRRSARPDAHASDRVRWPSGGFSEATSEFFGSHCQCDVQSARSKADCSKSAMAHHHYSFINQFGVFEKWFCPRFKFPVEYRNHNPLATPERVLIPVVYADLLEVWFE